MTVKTSQRPLFPNVFVLNPRPCIDHTAQCTRWAKDHPESCIPGNLGYAFMREACQESCGRCGEKVNTLGRILGTYKSFAIPYIDFRFCATFILGLRG